MLDDDTLARKICAHLGRQPEVPAQIAYRLSQAREHALMRVSTSHPNWARLLHSISPRTGAVIALVVLGFTYATWQISSSKSDTDDVDARLLSGELPPAAYLDPGFARFVSGKGNQ